MKVKKILPAIVFLFVTNLANGQTPTYQWAKNMGGHYGYSIGMSIAVDDSGNVYTTGNFEGRVDFDPGAGVSFLTALGTSYDAFVTKTDSSGNFIWAKQFSGISGSSGATSIAVNGSGNICIAGNFAGTIDFDPGIATLNLTSTAFPHSCRLLRELLFRIGMQGSGIFS